MTLNHSIAPGIAAEETTNHIPSPAPATTALEFIDWINGQVTSFVGLPKIRDLRLSNLLSDAIRWHSFEEVESKFSAGMPSTTPGLQDIEVNSPRPWAFVWLFGFLSAICVVFAWMFGQFQNERLVPAMLILGALATPCALVVLFFELNTPRNVSIYRLIKLFIVGAAVSILLALCLFKLIPLVRLMGAMAGGPIEELAKASVLLLVVNNPRYRWSLNGLLFGATVGAGFSAFETAGYAFQSGMGVLALRSVLTLIGLHVVWTAPVGAALWRVRGNRKFELAMLKHPQFLRTFFLAVGLHAAWNSGYGFYTMIPCGIVAWVAVIAYVQDGLDEVRMEQIRQAATLANKEIS